MTRRHRAITACLTSLVVLWGATATCLAADDEGTADHPLVSRYPGQEIRFQSIENFRPYRVPVGPVTGYRTIGEWIDVEGRLTRIFYVYEGADRTHEEIYRNYRDALADSGFEILGHGAPTTRAGKQDVGGRTWQAVALAANPWPADDPDLATLTAGTSTEGGSAAVVAHKDRAAGPVYVVVQIEQHSAEQIGTLVDILEVEAAETGLVTVDAEAIGRGIEEEGRIVLDGILFDYDAATLRDASRPALEAIAAYLAAHPERDFYVVGHTDAKGTFAYNQKLSSDRARAVVDALTRGYGVDSSRLVPNGV